jgi:hypothetical protein
MTKLYFAISLGALVLLSAGCASDQASSRADSALVLKMAAKAGDDGSSDRNLGQIASIWGDTHTSTLLFERATAASPTPINKFNLAGAYQNEGRIGDALELYDQVEKEGTMSFATTLAPRDDRSARNVAFNLSTAAGERSAGIIERVRLMPTGATSDDPIDGMSPMAAARRDAQENPLKGVLPSKAVIAAKSPDVAGL